MATEWVYGLIFTAYVACFIFIASYMMTRKNEKHSKIIENTDLKINRDGDLLKENNDEKKMLELKQIKVNDIFDAYKRRQKNLNKLSKKKIQIESELLSKQENFKKR